MKSGGEGCIKVFSLPQIVKEYSEKNPELKKELDSFCRYDGDQRKNICFYPLVPHGSEGPAFSEDRFCIFKNKIEELESSLNAVRHSRALWAENAQQKWQERAKNFGTFYPVSTRFNGWGNQLAEVGVFFDVPLSSTRISLEMMAVKAEVAGDKGRKVLDGGFSLYFDTPAETEAWLEANLGSAQQAFSGCASRLAFVDHSKNRNMDDLYHCWSQTEEARRFSDPWRTWQDLWNPRFGLM